jgi:hypothetical protein
MNMRLPEQVVAGVRVHLNNGPARLAELAAEAASTSTAPRRTTAADSCYIVSMRHQTVAAVTGAQLALNLAGLMAAVRGRHPYDLHWFRGSPDHIVRDALWMGSSMSAPGPLVVAQAVSVAVLLRRDSQAARRAVRALGVAMSGGYPIERHVRRRLTRGGWHRVESPVVIGGWALALAMAAIPGKQRPRA